MFDFKSLFRNKAYHVPMTTLASIPRATTELALGQEYRAHRVVVNSLSMFNTSTEAPSRERLKTLMRLDESSYAFQDSLSTQYLDNPELVSRVESKLWEAIFSYFWQLAHGYQAFVKYYVDHQEDCDFAELIPLIVTRALHYFAMECKWRYFKQETVHPNMWKRLNKLYRLSESRRFTRTNVIVNSAVGSSHSGAEFARALLLNALSPQQLSPQQIDLADRLITSWGRLIHIDKHFNRAKHEWCVDLGSAVGLIPINEPSRAAKFRYLNVYALLRQIEEYLQELRKGRLPGNLSTPNGYDQPMYMELLAHMATKWNKHPRKSTSRVRYETVEVAFGVESIEKNLLICSDISKELKQEACLVAGSSTYEREQWLSNGARDGSPSMTLELAGDQTIIPGLLIGVKQVDKNGRWTIGVVRRVDKKNDSRALLGIETLSFTPKLIHVISSSEKDTVRIPGIFLPRIDNAGIASSLIIPLSEFVTQRLLELDDAKSLYQIRLADVLEQSEDWIRIKFDVLGRHMTGMGML